MNSHISVPIPTKQFLDLVDFLREKGDVRDPVEVIGFAIEYFVVNAELKEDDLIETNDSRGYQWKDVFLPHSSQVRMQYKGRYFYARVEGDELQYDGASISPGALANKIASSNRNAWHDLWIKRPGDKDWKLAADLREDTAAANRKLEELLAQPNPPGEKLP